MVAFVLSNFDESRQCLGLDNNRSLLSFEQSESNETLHGACMDSYFLSLLQGFGSDTVCFCFMMLYLERKKALFLRILKLN